MKRFSFLTALLAFAFCVSAADLVPTYKFVLDLQNVKDDKVMVRLTPGAISGNEVVYSMPKMVPGTYAIYDFGRFLSDFKALDKAGKELPVKKLDENRWQISNARQLSQITYWVEDTYDTEQKNHVFEPGGTNIEAGKNFMLNTHGFFGYFDGMKKAAFEVTVLKPQGFYGSTPLRATATTPASDTYQLSSYNELVDSPLMYCQPDTSLLKVGGAEVLVSLYTPSGKVDTDSVAGNIKEILQAQAAYLGGKLPIEKYAFLIYLTDKMKMGSFGALEHSYSSVYFMPETSTQDLAKEIRSIAAHEFFHIVTPLSIHSEEIGDFNFTEPKMSKHLWLYEGVTEYFASHVQVYEGLITEKQYFDMLREYIMYSKMMYNDSLPFTEMSLGALDTHKKEYGNVYQKGALIGMALDIQLREQSGGKYGLRNLMFDLSKTYGKDKSFKDEELFDQITALTFPEIRTFFKQFVEGPEPLPLEALFAKVGMKYAPKFKERKQRWGIGIDFKPGQDQPIVASTFQMTEFGKVMGFQKGDRLVSINGEVITRENLEANLDRHVRKAELNSPLTVVVKRIDSKGREKERKLKGKVTAVEEDIQHALLPDPKANPQQVELRNAWLHSKK